MTFTKYDSLGNDYHWLWAKAGKGTPYYDFIHKVLSYLPLQGNGLRVYDLGCGDGYPLSLLADRGYQVYGYDTHLGALTIAGEKVPIATLYTTPIVDTYDYATCIEVVEHMGNEGIQHLLEIVENARLGAIISTPPIEDNHGMGKVYKLPDIQSLFPNREVQQVYSTPLHQIFMIGGYEWLEMD